MKDSSDFSLEDYHLLYRHPWRASTVLRPNLDKVMEMHGLTKLSNKPKSLVIESLKSIDLIPPVRSTLDRPTSSPLPLTVGEVESDMQALGWQDIYVPSIQTLNSVADMVSTHTRHEILRAPPASFVIAGRRRRTKRNRASVDASTDLPSQPLPSPPPLPPPSPPPSPPPGFTPPPYPPSPECVRVTACPPRPGFVTVTPCPPPPGFVLPRSCAPLPRFTPLPLYPPQQLYQPWPGFVQQQSYPPWLQTTLLLGTAPLPSYPPQPRSEQGPAMALPPAFARLPLYRPLSYPPQPGFVLRPHSGFFPLPSYSPQCGFVPRPARTSPPGFAPLPSYPQQHWFVPRPAATSPPGYVTPPSCSAPVGIVPRPAETPPPGFTMLPSYRQPLQYPW